MLEADFLVLRTPLLPLDTLSQWSDGVAAPGACGEDDEELERALAADRALLRCRLFELLADEQVAQSLELASPDLADGVPRWHSEPDSRAGRSVERSLVRYMTRLASRPALFGLGGSYLVGRFDSAAALDLGSRAEIEVQARVDSGLLRDLVREAATRSLGHDDTLVRCNPALYRVGDRIRVATREAGSSKHRLVAVASSVTTERALSTAGEGASIDSILVALIASGCDRGQARNVVRRLLASGLLLPMATVTVTGPEPTEQAARALASLPAGGPYREAAERAAAAVSEAARLDRRVSDAVVSALEPTGLRISRRHCLQVDSRRTGTARLPARVLAEIRNAADLLARISPPPSDAQAFREAFERRFGTRRVPLLEALDPDIGVRLTDEFDPRAPSAARSSLPRRRALLELIARGHRSPDGVVELTEPDIAALARDTRAEIVGSIGLLASLAARDVGAMMAGEFGLVEPMFHGPPGVLLLGRLCRSDPELEVLVRNHLKLEATLEPDVVLAELSAAPETEFGLNIAQRPVLREWEIEYAGDSGGPRQRVLTPADLTVSVVNREMVLHSVSLGQEVRPRLTTAMNPGWISLPAARFLTWLAQRQPARTLGWSWDEVAVAPELPRVVVGRTILALRRWNIAAADLKAARGGGDCAGFRRLQAWRQSRGIPRAVTLEQPGTRMLVDFDNVLSVEAFLASVRDSETVALIEFLAPETCPVTGPDGRYAHEVIVPLIQALPRPSPVRRRRAPSPVGEAQRRFVPGGEWLYLNLYGPIAGVDRMLVEHIGPLAAGLREQNLISGWFFVRFYDQGDHLRLRFRGDPGKLLRDVLPATLEVTATALDQALIHRVSIDTYEREVERYGGLKGVELMEQIAQADSEAVIELIARPLPADRRRQLAVASIAALYDHCGLPVAARRDCCTRLRANWLRTLAFDPRTRLASDQRAERSALSELFAALEHEESTPPVGALTRRSHAIQPQLDRLAGLDAEGVLEKPLGDVIGALAHMAINRLLRRGGNYDEVRVHDALARHYDAVLAHRPSTQV